MARTMRAARLHGPEMVFRVEDLPLPILRPHDVLVRVKASGVIPNMNYVFKGTMGHLLPPLPAVLGLDAAGIVDQVGDEVGDIREGDRVYINPLLSCGACHFCRMGEPSACDSAAMRGYFAFSPKGFKLLAQYPIGGFAEYTSAPARSLVKLPAEVTFEQAARFGYLGTSYAALKAGGAKAASWALINGATGTLGVGAVLWALALGVTRILGTGRNREVLAKVRSLSPRRIDTLALGDEPMRDWVLRRTDGQGVNVLIDCTGRGSHAETSSEALGCLQRKGVAVTVSALRELLAIDPRRFMDDQLQFRGQNFFSVAQGQEMAELARAGVVDLGVLEPRVYPLQAVNEALADIKHRPGGFVNIVVAPDR